MSEIQARFEELANTWEVESRTMTSPVQMAELPSYQAIIALGAPAVPLILNRLKNKSIDYWFIALEAITGQNPIPASHQGYPEAMTIDWLLWGFRLGMFRAT